MKGLANNFHPRLRRYWRSPMNDLKPPQKVPFLSISVFLTLFSGINEDKDLQYKILLNVQG